MVPGSGSVPKCHRSATLVSNPSSQSSYASPFSNYLLFCSGGWPPERQGRLAQWEPRFAQWELEFPRLQTWSGGSTPAAGQTGKTSSLFIISMSREYWMIYGGPGFLASYPPPPPPPARRQKVVSPFLVILCVAGQAYSRERRGGGGGGAKLYETERKPSPL